MILYVTWVKYREQPCYVDDIGLNIARNGQNRCAEVRRPPPYHFFSIYQSRQFNPAKLKALYKFRRCRPDRETEIGVGTETPPYFYKGSKGKGPSGVGGP